MGEHFVQGIITVALAVTGVAVLAVLVSRNSQTPRVLGASGNAFAESLTAAEQPVLGGTYNYSGGAAYGGYNY